MKDPVKDSVENTAEGTAENIVDAIIRVIGVVNVANSKDKSRLSCPELRPKVMCVRCARCRQHGV